MGRAEHRKLRVRCGEFSGAFVESFASTINAVVLGILLIGFLIAGIVMFVFMVTPGSEGTNDYGPDPYSPDALEEVFA